VADLLQVTSGAVTFEILPPKYKSLAVRTKVEYAPHPYVWMAPARALPTGLGIVSEGLELPLEDLPPWEKEKIKILPMVQAASQPQICPLTDRHYCRFGRTRSLASFTSKFILVEFVYCTSTPFQPLPPARARFIPTAVSCLI
jgi:hypothetical protein